MPKPLLLVKSSLVIGCCGLLSLFALAGGCEVYDPDLVGVKLTPNPASPDAHVPDTGTLDATMSIEDAGEDASIKEPECLPTESPDCLLRCRERCNAQDDDCDGVVDEATAGELCQLPASIAVCVKGSCLIASCESAHVDCNERAEDGCEATLDSTEHCGVCNHACQLANAQANCRAGRCEVGECRSGFDDCDGKPENGCERALNTLMDCGACGAACRAPHTVTDCSTGMCRFVRCEAGWGDCNDDAAKTTGGDGCETDLSAPSSCGDCANACPSSAPYCAGGKCTALACPATQADCDADNKTCETDLRTVSDCGGCGASCGGVANATVRCSATGTCEPTCNPGFESCDESFSNGCETNIHSVSSCGACGVACTHANATSACSTGTCQLAACNSGFGDCNGTAADGCEQKLNTNTHCAQCGRSCVLSNASATCSSGSCQVASCSTSFGNCDGNASNGCEANLTNSTQHCGACGQACPANFVCLGGRCMCDSNSDCGSGQACCDGSCVDLRASTSNCGACGNVCNSGQTCCSGTCKSLSDDFNNCGSCGHSCGNNSNRCTSGQCRCTNDNPCSGLTQCCSNGCHTFLFCL